MIIIKKRKLSNSKLYTSGEYSNPYYKFLEPETGKINSYDVNLCYISSELINNTYQCIAKENNHYISSKTGITNKLYKVSKDYKELDEIELKIPEEFINEIKRLFCDKKNKKIIITTLKNVYSVTLDGDFIKEEANTNLLDKEISYHSQILRDLNGFYFPVENKTEINNAYFTCCQLFFNKKYVGISKNGSAYLLEISKRGNLIRSYFIDDNIEINSLIVKNNYLELLVTKNKKCSYIYKTNKTGYKKYHNKQKESHSNDIVSSISLIDVSLANIINLESVKLQRCLTNSDDIDEILKASDSVNKTIKNITSLEKNLYNMLVRSVKEDNNIKKESKKIK